MNFSRLSDRFGGRRDLVTDNLVNDDGSSGVFAMGCSRLAWHGLVPWLATGLSARTSPAVATSTQGSCRDPVLVGAAGAFDVAGPKTSGITRGACLARMYPAITMRNTAKIRLSVF